MIASGTTSSATAFAPIAAASGSSLGRRRINAASARALEKLGHGIEYLSDEFVHENGIISWRNGQLQAIELLMSLCHSVYCECPEAVTLGDRCRALMRRCLA